LVKGAAIEPVERERGAQVVCIAPTDATSANLTDELGAEHIPFAAASIGALG